jgi:hypothetical protein
LETYFPSRKVLLGAPGEDVTASVISKPQYYRLACATAGKDKSFEIKLTVLTVYSTLKRADIQGSSEYQLHSFM